MFGSILTALIQVSATSAEPPAPPRTEWGDLPALNQIRSSTISPDDTRAIMEIVRENPECQSSVTPMSSPPDTPHMRMVGIAVQLIVLVPPRGDFLRIIAAPGPCDPVRNYARALVNARHRRVVHTPEGPGPTWYRTGIAFSWEP